MALNKIKLKSDIKTLVQDMQNREQDSTEEFADRLAEVIDAYVKEISIQYVTGLVAPSGAVTGNAKFNIS